MKYQEAPFGLPLSIYDRNIVDEETKLFRNGCMLPYQFPPINLLSYLALISFQEEEQVNLPDFKINCWTKISINESNLW